MIAILRDWYLSRREKKNKIKSFIFPLVLFVLKTFEKTWNKYLYLRRLWQEKKQTTCQVAYFAKDKKKLRRYRFLRRKCLWTIVFNRRSSSWRDRVRSAGLVVSCRRVQLQAINIALPQSSFILLEVVVSGFYYKRPKFMLTVPASIFNLRIVKWCYWSLLLIMSFPLWIVARMSIIPPHKGI